MPPTSSRAEAILWADMTIPGSINDGVESEGITTASPATDQKTVP